MSVVCIRCERMSFKAVNRCENLRVRRPARASSTRFRICRSDLRARARTHLVSHFAASRGGAAGAARVTWEAEVTYEVGPELRT